MIRPLKDKVTRQNLSCEAHIRMASPVLTLPAVARLRFPERCHRRSRARPRPSCSACLHATRLTISSRERSKIASRICARSCLFACADDEEHAGAVLDVAGRKQLPLQQLHDDGRFAAVKAAGIAAAIQFGEEL